MCADGFTPAATTGVSSILPKVLETRSLQQLVQLSGAAGGVGGEKSPIHRALKAGDLILWVLTVVDLLELTTGFGPPEGGNEFERGSQQFSALSEQLRVALPDDRWQGAASQAYAELDATLANVSQSMAQLDLRLAALIHDQADWVTHIRLAFGVLKDFVIAAYLIETAMIFLSPAAARVFAYAVCGLGLAAAVGMLCTLGYFSYENAQQANDLANQYAQLSRGPVPGGPLDSGAA